MRMSPTTRGYQHKVAEPQKFSKSLRDPDSLIVTPAYDEWLVNNPEITAKPEILEQVLRLITKPPRDRRRSFSASQAGYCLRRQELAFLGAKKVKTSDPRGIRIFQNGTFVHLRWQVGLLSARIIDGIEVTVKSGDGLDRATLDGIGVVSRGAYKGARYGWEHKGRMSFAFDAQERAGSPDVKTRKQVARQMVLTGYDVWSVTNENKNDQAHGEFIIEHNQEELDDAREELKALTTSIARKKLHPMLPECIKRNTTGEYYKCPFGTDGGACINSGNWPRTP